MRFLVLIISLILACVSSAAQEDSNTCGNCKHKLEYCDPYESTCQPCEAICLPPTNQKFAECGKLCHNFIQDILIGMVYFSYIYDSFEHKMAFQIITMSLNIKYISIRLKLFSSLLLASLQFL